MGHIPVDMRGNCIHCGKHLTTSALCECRTVRTESNATRQNPPDRMPGAVEEECSECGSKKIHSDWCYKDKPPTASGDPCARAAEAIEQALEDEKNELRGFVTASDIAAIIRREVAGHCEKEIERLNDQLNLAAASINGLQDRLATAERERDEANNKLAHLNESVAFFSAESSAMRQERDALKLENKLRKTGHARLVEVLPEGDAMPAHEQVADLRTRLATAERERDEARAKTKEADDYLSSRKIVELRPGTFGAVDVHIKTYIHELRAGLESAKQTLDAAKAALTAADGVAEAIKPLIGAEHIKPTADAILYPAIKMSEVTAAKAALAAYRAAQQQHKEE